VGNLQKGCFEGDDTISCLNKIKKPRTSFVRGFFSK
jgi:hypothetical protein